MLLKLTNILSIVLLVVACGTVVMFSSSNVGWKALSIPTGSMRPHIPPGSLVVDRRVSPRALKKGDVITYVNPLNPKKTITHRIIKVYAISPKVPGFVTKGDANRSADVPIAAGSVLGRVVWHVPHVGRWLIWGKLPIGILLMVYIPAALLMSEEVQRMHAYLKSIQPYKIWGYKEDAPKPHMRRAVKAASLIGAGCLIMGVMASEPALALLKTSPVVLANNRLSAAVAPPTSTCSSSTNVSVSNTSNQGAVSGSAQVTGNTSGGSATSGSTSNSNSTSVNTSTHNSC